MLFTIKSAHWFPSFQSPLSRFEWYAFLIRRLMWKILLRYTPSRLKYKQKIIWEGVED